MGVGIIIFLTYQHYFGSSICEISSYISCETVNKSSYSEMFGIPTASLGAAYFVLMIVLLSLYERGVKYIKYSFYLSIAILVPSFYLTYIELFVLNSICIFCESTKIVIIILAVLSFSIMKRK